MNRTRVQIFVTSTVVLLLTLLAAILTPPMAQAAADDVPPAAKVIRTESLKPNTGPEGRPLPLVAHWHRRSLPLSFQIELIRKGHFILPWQAFDGPRGGRSEFSYAADLKQLRNWGLPLSLITGGQWEALFYTHPRPPRIALPGSRSPGKGPFPSPTTTIGNPRS